MRARSGHCLKGHARRTRYAAIPIPPPTYRSSNLPTWKAPMARRDLSNDRVGVAVGRIARRPLGGRPVVSAQLVCGTARYRAGVGRMDDGRSPDASQRALGETWTLCAEQSRHAAGKERNHLAAGADLQE